MIGKVCLFIAPFYDTTTNQNAFKTRPSLVIGEADSGDYNILPISRVTNRKYLDSDYDILVNPSIYPKLNLDVISYVRVH